MAEARQATPSGLDSDEQEMKRHSPTFPKIEMDDDETISEAKSKEERDRVHVHDGSESGSRKWIKKLKVTKDKKKTPKSAGSKVGDDLVTFNYFNTFRKVNDSMNFRLLKLLGRGGGGKVFLARAENGRDSGELFALKSISLGCWLPGESDTHLNARNEKEILSKIIRHPFMADLYYAGYNNGKCYLAMEYMCGGTLLHWMNRKDIMFFDSDYRFYLSEIIVALDYLHSVNILYRDLKPDNVLITPSGHIKLTDFGISKQFGKGESRTYSDLGTLNYIAPEILSYVPGGYGYAVDWWSLGVVFYEMMSNKHPFAVFEKVKQTKYNIKNRDFVMPRRASREAQSLLKGLLEKDPRKRLGGISGDAKPIQNHDFFRQITDWSDVYYRKIQAPYKPVLTNELDVRHFDEECTSEPPVDPPEEYSKNFFDAEFKDFSYYRPSPPSSENSSSDSMDTTACTEPLPLKLSLPGEEIINPSKAAPPILNLVDTSQNVSNEIVPGQNEPSTSSYPGCSNTTSKIPGTSSNVEAPSELAIQQQPEVVDASCCTPSKLCTLL